MRQNLFPTGQFHRLAPPGDIRGVSCDQNGPAIGPIRLMVKKGSRFAPHPVEELNRIFSLVIRRPIDCDDLVERLQSVTRALNEGQFARAIFATQYLHLPALTDEEAQRAVGAEALLKAAPDDPKHPGWPKGTEGGKGGKFRAKDSAAGESREQTVAEQKENIADRMARSSRQKIIRSTLRRMLSLRAGNAFHRRRLVATGSCA